jgi:hypothetical protein
MESKGSGSTGTLTCTHRGQRRNAAATFSIAEMTDAPSSSREGRYPCSMYSTDGSHAPRSVARCSYRRVCMTILMRTYSRASST